MFITFQINTEICQVPSNHRNDIFSKVYFWDNFDHGLKVKEAYAGQHCLHKVRLRSWISSKRLSILSVNEHL